MTDINQATPESGPAEAPPTRRPSWWRRWLLAVGIDATGPGRWHVRLKPRFFALVGVAIGAMFLGILGTAAWSESPSFCRSCHIMEPYYLAWADSKHNGVPCVDCHYPPGSPQTILWRKFQALSQVAKFVTRTYSSRPFADVEDASCLRSGCHATRLLQGRVVSERGILFDHRPHLETVRYGRQLTCASCHSQVVVGKHIEVTWDTCYLCHMKGRSQGRHIEPMGGCKGCHLMPEKEVKVGSITYNHKEFLGSHDVACQSCHQDAIEGSGEVPEERCLVCHNQPEKLARFKEIDFLHDNHVTKHHTACFHCHTEMRHGVTPAGGKKMDVACSSCHTEMHEIERTMYQGLGAKGVPPMPSPMYLANVDCVGCHLERKKNDHGSGTSGTYVGSEKGCLDCHGPEYQGLLPEVGKLVSTTEAALRATLQELEQARKLGDTASPKFVTVSGKLQEAGHNLDFIRSASPIHNVYYAAQVLRYTDESLRAAATELGAKTTDTSKDPILSGQFCGSLCHARVGVKMPPETVTYDGNEMPHAEHVANEIPCAECHTFGDHKVVKVKKEKLCDDCH